MNESKAKNEKVKRKFFAYLKGAEGFSEKTVEAVEKAIWKYEEFSEDEDFAAFSDQKAKQFKKWLEAAKNKRTKQAVCLTTQYHILRHLKEFFTWLSGQPGYKSRISPFHVQYLKLDKKQSRIAVSPKRVEYPSVEYVKKVCGSIEIKTEIDRRDRALIAFALLSAMRDSAIMSLPMGCFDPETLITNQDPNKGVKTKFSKLITTRIFLFDDVLLGYFLDWYNFLKKEKLYTNADPIFPRAELKQKSRTDYCFEGDSVEPVFWQSTGSLAKAFKLRASQAGEKYYSPHKFRHAAIDEARRRSRTPEQMKAISQNVGHENVGTTFSYGSMDDFRVTDVVSRMDFKQGQDQEGDLSSVPTDRLLKELGTRAGR